MKFFRNSRFMQPPEVDFEPEPDPESTPGTTGLNISILLRSSVPVPDQRAVMLLKKELVAVEDQLHQSFSLLLEDAVLTAKERYDSGESIYTNG